MRATVPPPGNPYLTRGGWFGASGTGGRGRGEGEHDRGRWDIEIDKVEAVATEAKQVGARRVSDEVTTGFHSYLSMPVVNEAELVALATRPSQE